jgi:hypothetical protein
MKLRPYLGSSVLGAKFDTESEYRVRTTRRFFGWLVGREHTACIFAVTLAELIRAPDRIRGRLEELLRALPLELLEESPESEALARRYLEARAVPPQSVADARHPAVASIHGVHAVVSWNFRHMVDLLCRSRVRSVNAVRWSREAKLAVSHELTKGVDLRDELEEAASRLGARVVPAPTGKTHPGSDVGPGNGRTSSSG